MNSHQTATVIGIGRLGLCLALCLEKAGLNVLGVDLSPEYVSQINERTLESPEPGVSAFLKESQHLRATTSIQEGIAHSDLCFIVVPTNTIVDIQSYDHTVLSTLLSEINQLAPSNKDLVICSTVFPGYCTQTGVPLLTNCKNTTLNYNPEFIAQGSILQGLKNPDLVLIGEGSRSAGDKLQAVYRLLCSNNPVIKRMSLESAEITKLALNCFITKKIAFANLIAEIADETLGANKETILDAIGADPRIGSKNLSSGYGFGGPCFPRDNRALGNYVSLKGLDPQFFRSTDTANENHADWMASKLLEQNLSEYLFEDVCYKPNSPVPIIECSQKLVVAKQVAARGKRVTIRDSETVLSLVRKEYGSLFNYSTKVI
jgi:nucleotide sugar dehydrogenase